MSDDGRKLAAIYTRVSTLDQAREGYSLAAQERTLRAWCADHGYTVYDVYSDEGISGKDITHRPEMQRLLSDAKDQRFDLVLVWALSRFTRSVADLYNSLSLLQASDVAFTSYTESFDTSSPVGRAMIGVCGVFAQLERELTAERVRAATLERAMQGKRMCNEILGYDLSGTDSLTINESEAECVRFIYASYLRYCNLLQVANLCRERGYVGKRGREFDAWKVKIILTRPVYAGYNTLHGHPYKGNFEPIIDEKTYNRVQRALEKHSKPRLPK